MVSKVDYYDVTMLKSIKKMEGKNKIVKIEEEEIELN